METHILELLQNPCFENDELFILTCPERFLPLLLSRPGVIRFQELGRYRVHAVLSVSHPLAKKDCITVDDLCTYPTTVLGTDIEMLRVLAGNRFSELRIRLHTTNFELYRATIGMQDNIALSVPLVEGRMKSPHLCHRPLEGAETIVFGYVVNTYAQSSLVNLELLNLMESEMQKLEVFP